MSILDDFSKKINDVSQSTVQKTKNLADMAKYNSMIADEQRMINGIYTEIGRQYYSQHREEPEEAFAAFVENIKTAEKKIEEYKEQLTALKGVVKCPECGAEVTISAAFCPACGKQMPVPAQEPEGAVRFCTGCGAKISATGKFCTICGKPVERSSQETATEETPVEIITDVTVE